MGLGDHRTVSSVRLRAGDLAAKDRDLVPQAIREAAEVYRELAAARPDAFRPDLAMALANLANRLGGLGRLEEALAAGEEAAGIYRELAAARPDAFRPGLALALANLANQLADLRRPEEALAAIREATGTFRELAARWPDVYHRELEMSLQIAAGFEHIEDQTTHLRGSLVRQPPFGP